VKPTLSAVSITAAAEVNAESVAAETVITTSRTLSAQLLLLSVKNQHLQVQEDILR
jgi:hypothetical protein